MKVIEHYNAALQDQLRDLTQRAIDETVLGFEVATSDRVNQDESEHITAITIRWGRRPTNETRPSARQEPAKVSGIFFD